MKSLIFTFLTLLAFNTEASVLCHTPRMNKIFEVSDKKITFFNEFDSHAKRELASVSSRTKSADTGVTKIVDFENQKHTHGRLARSHFFFKRKLFVPETIFNLS